LHAVGQNPLEIYNKKKLVVKTGQRCTGDGGKMVAATLPPFSQNLSYRFMTH